MESIIHRMRENGIRVYSDLEQSVQRLLALNQRGCRMYDYRSFLFQQMRYEDDVRQAANDRLARQAQHRSFNLSLSAFNSLAVIGAILFAILILVASGATP